MKEIIESITELNDTSINEEPEVYTRYQEMYDGYMITTNKQNIYVLISSGQNCCEQYGYISFQDDLKQFIGSELLSLSVVDTTLNTQTLDSKFPYGFDGGDIVFVHFETTVGTMELAVYNAHNGYYGHRAKILSNTINEYKTI